MPSKVGDPVILTDDKGRVHPVAFLMGVNKDDTANILVLDPTMRPITEPGKGAGAKVELEIYPVAAVSTPTPGKASWRKVDSAPVRGPTLPPPDLTKAP